MHHAADRIDINFTPNSPPPGLVGSKAVKFTLMGETVDVARQLAATGCPMAVHVSATVCERLKEAPGYKDACMPWTLQRLGYGGGGASGPLPAVGGGEGGGSGGERLHLRACPIRRRMRSSLA